MSRAVTLRMGVGGLGSFPPISSQLPQAAQPLPRITSTLHVRVGGTNGSPAARATPQPLAGTQLLTEFNQQLAVAAALVGWQSQDAGHVIVFRGLLFLEERGG